MKKQIAGLLALVLLCGIPFPAYAADIETPQSQIVSVKYSDIDQMVRTSNQTIRANVKSLDSLQNNDVIAEKQQELSSSAAALQDVNKMLQNAYAAINTPGVAVTSEQQAISASLQGSMASINAICSILSAQKSQLDVSEDTIDKTELQMKQSADQIVIAAQQLFVSYHFLNSQRSALIQKQKLSDDTIQIAKQKYDLGFMTATELLTAQQTSQSIRSSIAALVLQMQTVKNNLRVLMGYSKDYDLNFSSLPSVDTSFISKMNDATDYQTALDANYTLRLKKMEKDIADENRDDDSNSNDDPDSTVLDYQSAALNYRIAINTFDASFRRVFDAVHLKQEQLATELSNQQSKVKTLDMQTKKWSVGQISAMDLETAQQDVSAQNAAVQQAEINLFTSVEQYRWALNGTIIQSEN